MENLDKADKQILNLLQQDSNLTIKEIAGQMDLSTTPVFERIKKLEKAGYITKYVALLNAKKLGRKLTVFINVSLQKHSKDAVEKFVTEISCFKEVQELHHVSGDSDFLVKVLLADMEAYNDFVLNKLGLIKNTSNIRSQFALSNRKYSTEVMLN
jgi:DNA-binding Lrp family transcriptional regulator